MSVDSTGIAEPITFEAAVAAGNSALGSQDIERALLSFEQAHQLSPMHVLPHIMLGVVLMQIGQLDSSEQQYAAAINLMQHAHNVPYGEAVFFNAGLCRLKLGKYQEAADALESAARIAPSNTQIWLNAAQAHDQIENGQKAVRALRTVCTLQPDTAQNHANLGSLLLKYDTPPTPGTKEEAEKELLQAIQLDPTLVVPTRALLTMLADRPQEMKHYARVVVSLDPSDISDAIINLVAAVRMRRTYGSSFETYKQFLADTMIYKEVVEKLRSVPPRKFNTAILSSKITAAIEAFWTAADLTHPSMSQEIAQKIDFKVRKTDFDIFTKQFTQVLAEQQRDSNMQRRTVGGSGGRLQRAIIIEPRRHMALQSVIANTCDKLSGIKITLVHGGDNAAFAVQVADESPCVDQVLQINADNLNSQTYSKLLASQAFWSEIDAGNDELVLIFQTDSGICGAGDNIERFLRWDYW
jgi:tetratricopeptide (TPR) repeat protein